MSRVMGDYAQQEAASRLTRLLHQNSNYQRTEPIPDIDLLVTLRNHEKLLCLIGT